VSVHADIEQGTVEWFELRRGIVTASVMGKLVTPTLKVAANETSRTLARLLASERITGRIEPTFTSDAMARGHADEPLARNLYSELHAPAVEVGFIDRIVGIARLGYSPDGVVGDDGLIEVKSAEPKIQLDRILGAPIEHAHMAQMQTGMFVSGRKWCDFLTYCGGMPMWRVRVEASDAWFDVITDATVSIEADIVSMIDAYNTAVEGLPVTEYINHFPEIEF